VAPQKQIYSLFIAYTEVHHNFRKLTVSIRNYDVDLCWLNMKSKLLDVQEGRCVVADWACRTDPTDRKFSGTERSPSLHHGSQVSWTNQQTNIITGEFRLLLFHAHERDDFILTAERK